MAMEFMQRGLKRRAAEAAELHEQWEKEMNEEAGVMSDEESKVQEETV